MRIALRCLDRFAERGALNALLDAHGRDETYFETYSTWKLHSRIAKEAAAGLNHAHQCQYTHGDIKSPNILICQSFAAKIADFGMSAFWRQDHGQTLEEPASSGLSLMWAAPELFTCCRTSFETDVYAFGIVLWEIAACIAPFGDNVPTGAIPQLVCSGVRPDLRVIQANKRRAAHMSPRFTNLIESCWHPDARQRPTMGQVYETLQYISDELEPDETRGRGHRGTGRPREKSLWLESSSSSVTPKESSTSGSSTDPEDLLTSAAKYAARSSSEQTSDSDTDAVDGDTDSLSQLSESSASALGSGGGASVSTQEGAASYTGPYVTAGGVYSSQGSERGSGPSSGDQATTSSSERSGEGGGQRRGGGEGSRRRGRGREKVGSNASSQYSGTQSVAWTRTDGSTSSGGSAAEINRSPLLKATRRKSVEGASSGGKGKKKAWECPLCCATNPPGAGECVSCGCINDSHTGRSPSRIKATTWPMALPSIPESTTAKKGRRHHQHHRERRRQNGGNQPLPKM